MNKLDPYWPPVHTAATAVAHLQHCVHVQGFCCAVCSQGVRQAGCHCYAGL